MSHHRRSDDFILQQGQKLSSPIRNALDNEVESYSKFLFLDVWPDTLNSLSITDPLTSLHPGCHDHRSLHNH